jgi:hypothetical protein
MCASRKYWRLENPSVFLINRLSSRRKVSLDGHIVNNRVRIVGVPIDHPEGSINHLDVNHARIATKHITSLSMSEKIGESDRPYHKAV